MMEKQKKYRVYIDEVGNSDIGSSDDSNHQYLSLTGLIFELEYVKTTVHPAVEELKQKYFPYHPDEPIILHRKELVNKKYPFGALKDKKIEENFNKDFIRLIKILEYAVVSVLIDKKEHNLKYSTWKHDPYHYCMEVLIERFFFFLRDNKTNGDVMIESRGGKEDIRLKRSFTKIFENGTNFIEAKYLQERFTSKELKVKPKKLNIACLQLADLLSHSSRRYMFKFYKISEGKSHTFGDEIIKIIEQKYYKNNNIVEGYGIKMLL